MYSVLLTDSLMENMELTFEQLYSDAMERAPLNYPLEIYKMGELIDLCNLVTDSEDELHDDVFVASAGMMKYGAGCISL